MVCSLLSDEAGVKQFLSRVAGVAHLLPGNLGVAHLADATHFYVRGIGEPGLRGSQGYCDAWALKPVVRLECVAPFGCDALLIRHSRCTILGNSFRFLFAQPLFW